MTFDNKMLGKRQSFIILNKVDEHFKYNSLKQMWSRILFWRKVHNNYFVLPREEKRKEEKYVAYLWTFLLPIDTFNFFEISCVVLPPLFCNFKKLAQILYPFTLLLCNFCFYFISWTKKWWKITSLRCNKSYVWFIYSERSKISFLKLLCERSLVQHTDRMDQFIH